VSRKSSDSRFIHESETDTAHIDRFKLRGAF
jgi:hypothetical protein